MRLHIRCVVVVMFLLVPTTALANDHVARLFGGYSKLKSSSFDGAHGSVEVALPFTNDWVGIVVDSSVHIGSDANKPVTKATILFGPRVVWRPGGKRFVLFGHVLPFGYHRSHIGDQASDDSAWGGGFGGDVILNGLGSGAAAPKSGWILSVQADWVRVAGDASLRVNTGVGFRYK